MISVLCPTRGRPGQVRNLAWSARDNARGEVEFVFYLDVDDATAEQVRALEDGRLKTVTGPRGNGNLSEMWNRCYELATGDIFMHCGDDIIFRTMHWDKLVQEAFNRYSDRLVLVHGRDGFQDQRMATHGFYSREWVNVVGYFMPPYFVSDFNDKWWTEVADTLGRRVFLPELLTEHMHPVAGKGEWDVTHRERIRRHRQDRPDRLYQQLAHLRNEHVAKLRKAIEAGQHNVDNSDRNPGL